MLKERKKRKKESKRSYIEADDVDLYTLKGKRTVGKVNKGINVEKI